MLLMIAILPLVALNIAAVAMLSEHEKHPLRFIAGATGLIGSYTMGYFALVSV